MSCSNVFTPLQNIPAVVWGLQSASVLSSGTGDASGWSLSPDEVRHFSLCSPEQPQSEPLAAANAPRILLIEDNAADIGLVREALEEHNVRCDLTVVTTGERAITLIGEIDSGSQHLPNLIIVDLNLPKRSGKEVLKQIRMSWRCAALPVIVLTSSENQRDKDDVAAFRPAGYFRKPSRLDEFLGLGAIFKQAVNSGMAGGA